jgi:CHASE3 domain sensor protein
MINIKKHSFVLPIAALALLAIGDYVAVNALMQDYEQDLNELQQLREQDASKVKRHIQLCLVAEAISRLDYDAGVAMGGYSITKARLFYNRFQQIVESLPKKIQELKDLVSTVPVEEPIVQSISTQSLNILAINREVKAMIDNPKITADQVKQRHVYKTIRGSADRLQQDIQALSERDLALMHETLHKGARIPNRKFQIFLLAFFNAICGCFLLWLLGGLKELKVSSA